MKSIKEFLNSLFSDKDFDWDLSKFVGFGCVVVGIVGFFLAKDNFQFVFLAGCGLLGWKNKVEGC